MDSLKFMLAGNAVFTLTNKKTGNHFTYRITSKENTPHFVSLLTGPDNTHDYTFLGTIFDGKEYRHSRKSVVGEDAQGVKVFKWAFQRLLNGGLPEGVEVKHCGYCGACGRLLTTPESLTLGFGPHCARKGKRDE